MKRIYDRVLKKIGRKGSQNGVFAELFLYRLSAISIDQVKKFVSKTLSFYHEEICTMFLKNGMRSNGIMGNIFLISLIAACKTKILWKKF